MKIIISRKGFDAENGGCASPILPDGTMLSFPIPQSYYPVDSFDSISYGGKSYMTIWDELRPNRSNHIYGCHLDPDIRPGIRDENPKDWKAVFGQCEGAEGHLENQGVGLGDIFMFFGWFKDTEEYKGKLRYKRGSEDIHAFYGYLQIGEIVRDPEESMKYYWHPHSGLGATKDTMYVASDHLIIDGMDTGLKGYGTFRYSPDVVLTMPGMPKSRWKLPDFFKDVNISCHSIDCFKPEGYFQSVRIGQEFVVSESPQVTKWAANIIMNNSEEAIAMAKDRFIASGKGIEVVPPPKRKEE